MEGYIYIIENQSFIPGLLKIGMTEREPQKRIKELSSSSGVPTEFNILYTKKIKTPRIIEQLVHDKFKKYRYEKEFFQVELDMIVKFIESLDPDNLPKVKEDFVYSSEFATGDCFDKLVDTWRESYPNGRGIKYIRSHIDIIKKLTDEVLSLGPDIKINFYHRYITFSDGLREFLGVIPQATQVKIAPLTLNPEDISDLNYPYDDITNKKYSLGGRVRLKINDIGDIDTILEIARRSYSSKNIIKTWKIFGLRKK